jgi:spore coat protein U-like protein
MGGRASERGRWLWAGLALVGAPTAAQTVNCTISATPMAFGTYDPSSTTALGPVTSTIAAQCTVPPGNPITNGFTMSVSLSTGSSGTYTPRRMTSTPPGGTVNYNLYTTATATTIWGDGTAGTATVALTIPKITPGQSGAASALAYGFVPPLQVAPPGDYADAISVIAVW